MMRYIKGLLTFYTTTRLVRIRSTFLAVVYLIVVTFMSITFFLGWLHLDVKKAYQKSCPVMGVVSVKVKGFASTEHLPDKELKMANPKLYKRTWDFVDLVSPPFGGEGQYTGFTVATNFVITANQTRGFCAEEADGKNACVVDEECSNKTGTWRASSGHGVYTGKCVKGTNETSGTCEISGWCPIENDSKDRLPFQGQAALLEEVKNFTVLIKNSVSFPGCGNQKRQNLLKSDEVNLRHCTHDQEKSPKCPIFRLGDIVQWSNENFSEVAIRGGVFKVEINWICDFDFGKTIEQCEPKYSFFRVDDKKFDISKGWNFRYANYHEENRRTLYKVFGLQFLIAAVGEGRKFELFETIISIGAMVGLFAVASLVCDFLFDILCLLNSLHCSAMKNYTPELRFGGNELSFMSKISPVADEEMVENCGCNASSRKSSKTKEGSADFNSDENEEESATLTVMKSESILENSLDSHTTNNHVLSHDE